MDGTLEDAQAYPLSWAAITHAHDHDSIDVSRLNIHLYKPEPVQEILKPHDGVFHQVLQIYRHEIDTTFSEEQVNEISVDLPCEHVEDIAFVNIIKRGGMGVMPRNLK